MEEENEGEEDIDDDLLNTEDELPIIKVCVSFVVYFYCCHLLNRFHKIKIISPI